VVFVGPLPAQRPRFSLWALGASLTRAGVLELSAGGRAWWRACAWRALGGAPWTWPSGPRRRGLGTWTSRATSSRRASGPAWPRTPRRSPAAPAACRPRPSGGSWG
ncbi:unnamed protein product, partial [Prorocentrum cordatum]